jgi:hypothetical protein
MNFCSANLTFFAAAMSMNPQAVICQYKAITSPTTSRHIKLLTLSIIIVKSQNNSFAKQREFPTRSD